jgi:hypothetical protein
LLNRSIKRGDHGSDVLALGRALIAAKYKRGVIKNRRFGSAKDKQLRRFQRAHGIPADGILGPVTFERLKPFVDAYGMHLFSQAPKLTPQEQKFNELLAWCEKLTRDTPGYVWGGGHGPPLADLSTKQGMDCSSSCSLALWKPGLFPDYVAWVSGTFAWKYGKPGKGEFFTVYANADHVFIRFHKGPYWRFDTSPHGDGGRGPRLRRLPRFTFGFTSRHWEGF